MKLGSSTRLFLFGLAMTQFMLGLTNGAIIFQEIRMACTSGDGSDKCEDGPYCFGFSNPGTLGDLAMMDPCEDTEKFNSDSTGCNAFASVKRITATDFEIVLVGKVDTGSVAGWVGIGFSKTKEIMGPATIAFICSAPDLTVHKHTIDTKDKAEINQKTDDSNKGKYISDEEVKMEPNKLLCKFQLKGSAAGLDLTNEMNYVGIAGNKKTGFVGGKFQMHDYYGKSKDVLKVWKVLKERGDDVGTDTKTGLSGGPRKVAEPSLIGVSILYVLLWCTAT